MKKIKAETIIRTIVLFLALFNQVLTMFGYNIIPIEDETVSQLITSLFTIVMSVWAWWKNNSFTKAAIEADEVLAMLKRGEDEL